MMDPSLQELRRALAQAPRTVRMELRTDSAFSPFQDQMVDIIRKVSGAGGDRLVLEEQGGPSGDLLPCVTLRTDLSGTIRYMALPTGPEMAPFVDLLQWLCGESAPLSVELASRLSSLQEDAEITVFIAQQCPHCPLAVREAARLAAASPRVTLQVVDAQVFPSMTTMFSVKSVPMTVLDTGLSITGLENASTLVEHLLQRGSDSHRSRVFASLADGGRAAEAGRMLTSEGGARFLVESWRGSTMSTRLGLMMAVEEALSMDPGCLDSCEEDLIAIMFEGDASLRGDTLDILSRIGTQKSVPAVRQCLLDDNPDVAEMAREALQEILQRTEGSAT